MNIFERLFGEKKFPFDQILDILGTRDVRFWNGTNHNREIMFKRCKDPDASRNIGGEYYTFEDPPPFCKVSIGDINDAIGPLIEVYIHQNTEIVWVHMYDVCRCSDHRKIWKRLTKLVNQLRKEPWLRTDNVIFRKMMAAYFNADIYSRVHRRISLDGLTEVSLERLEMKLHDNDVEYIKRYVPFRIHPIYPLEGFTNNDPRLTGVGMDNAEIKRNALCEKFGCKKSDLVICMRPR